MRYFWSLIAVLVLVTAGLSAARRASERAPAVGTPTAPPPSQTFGRPDPAPQVQTPDSRSSEPSPEPSPVLEPTPAETADVDLIEEIPVETPIVTDTRVADADTSGAARAEPEVLTPDPIEATPDAGLSLDALLGVIEEAKESLPPEAVVDAVVERSEPVVDPMLEAALASANASAADAGPVGPAFTVRGDGSVEVEGAGVIVGDGSPQRPFVIDWQVLRSVARDYNPKQGQEQLPDWVAQLDGKTVRVEGNTLLPVVAAAVDELLVMQNPWDGCCVGIPPTPYDAIEVKLSELTRMGNAATGFGMVEGTFKVDPYIVQGWLLGLYVIEDASFESAAGMVLPGL